MLTPIQALSKTLRQALIGLATAAATLAPAMAADEQESAPSARIARLAVIEGAVSFAPAGTTEWLAASPSHPLTQGDQVWVDKGGRAELRIGSTALRMDNLTELEICMERAVQRAGNNPIGADDVRVITGDAAADVPNLVQMEETALSKALAATHGNKTRAAALLGISRDTLRYRIEKYNISGPQG